MLITVIINKVRQDNLLAITVNFSLMFIDTVTSVDRHQNRKIKQLVQSSYRYGCPYLKITFQKHCRSLKITLHGNLSLSSIQK